MQTQSTDSDLLREKIDQLFMDRSTKSLIPFAQANMIIINPSVIRDLFFLAKIATPEENFDLSGLIKFLNKILSKQPINCLSVFPEGELHFSGFARKSLPRYLIEFFFELRSKNAERELLNDTKKLMIMLIQNNFLEKSVIKVIYQQPIKEYYQGFISKETLHCCLDILTEIFTVLESKPQSFFYFNFYESKLEYLTNNKRSLKWPFNNGLSVGLWFYMESLDTYESNFPSLFFIHCFQKGGGGVEAFFKGRKLFYRSLTINYEKASQMTDALEIGEFLPRKWYFLGIEHEKIQTFGLSSSFLMVYINDEEGRKFPYPFPKMEPGRTITNLSFGRGFVGKMTSIILFPSPIKKKMKDLFALFPIGIYTNPLLDDFNKKFLENNKIKPFILYCPNRILNNYSFEEPMVIDLIDQYNAKFSQNSGYRLKEHKQLRMAYLGGVSGLLPYFYFLRYLPDQSTAIEIFNKLFRILVLVFSWNFENQKEAGECNFFKIAGILLSETPFKLITHETMETLAEIGHSIKYERLLHQFFLEIIWNIPSISRIEDINLSADYFRFIRIFYVEDPLRYSNLLSIPSILRLAIYKFDAKNMECCLPHCLNLGLIKPNAQVTKEFKWEAEKILTPLFSIIELIMNHESIPEQIVCTGLKNIIESLIVKSSPCFQIHLLKLLKSMIIDGSCTYVNSEDFSKTIIESRLIYIMLYLVGNTLCPDIKAYCIKLINYLLNHQLSCAENDSPKEMASYLSLVLWNLTPKSQKSTTQNSKKPSLSEEEKTEIESGRSLRSRSKSINLSGNESEDKNSNSVKPVIRKRTFNLQINTEEINKAFAKENDGSDLEYNEIAHLAKECVNYMRRNTKIEKPLTLQNLIKTDYFKDKSVDENPTYDFEEISWDCEPLYNSIMEWLLGRRPANLESDLLIDDEDHIMTPDILILVFDFFRKSPGNLKAKIIQDFYMLVKWNQKNIQRCLDEREFVAWILDILLEQQAEMKEEGRNAFEVAIWDVGNKIMIILMRYLVEVNSSNSCDKLYYILQYLQLKSYITNNKKSSEKEREIALASKYLLRHIWASFLESLSDGVAYVKPILTNNFWKNMTFVIYFTFETVCSIYNPKAVSPGLRQKFVESYPSLKKCVMELKNEEKTPINFQGILNEYKHFDYKILENLFKILEPFWIENELNKPVSLLVSGEVEKLEKRVSNLLDYKYAVDFSQRIEILLHEPFFGDPNINCTKGPLIKLIALLLVLIIEFEIENKNMIRLSQWLDKLQLIFKSLLILGENAREKPFPLNKYQEKPIVSTLLYLLHFLYVQQEKLKKSSNLNELFVKHIKEIGLFMIFVIDHLNERYSGFANITKEFKSALFSSNTLIQPYNFLIYDIFNSFAFGPKSNKILTISDIKSLKHEDLLDLHNVVLSDNWVYAFTDNQALLSNISEFFNVNMYLKLSLAHQAANENKDSRRKCVVLTEEGNKRLKIKIENEVYELILLILELNEEKKNNDWYILEKKRRQAKFLWKKLWKKLRLFDNVWQHEDLRAQKDQSFRIDDYAFERIKPNKYFYLEMWKFETKSKARPFLKMKLKEPKIKMQCEESEKIVETFPNYQQIFNLIHQNFHLKEQFATESPLKLEKAAQNITGNLKNLGEKALNTLKSIVANTAKSEIALKSPTNEVLFQRKCQWIKPLFLKSGVFTLTPNKIIFHHDCNPQKETHLSIISYKLPSHRPFYKEWHLTLLKEVLPHRFILRKTSLNFIFKDGTSVLLNFPDTDPSIVLQRILSFTKSDIFFSLNTRILSIIKSPLIIEKTKLFKKWQNHEISNFAYLMGLNLLSGRSSFDITQYPVFPWIMSLATYYMKELPTQVLSPEKIFRDLSKSMGALGDAERIRTFKERFEHRDAFDPVPNYHFGSHYSSPAIIMQYLIRLAPFNQGHKELQGGKFDLADRLFFSLNESFKGATEEISDVRELTPEFFFCPEFLVNFEKLDFGVQQTGNRVNNIRLPKWSDRPLDNMNPYNFIKMHRELFEQEYVSENINNWIDLIFGYKQRGKEAEKNLNTFFYLTYEDSFNLDTVEKENFRVSYESQIIHFGQTPRQIFLKPHPGRLSFYELYREGRIITDPEFLGRNYKYKLDTKKKDHKGNEEEAEIVLVKFVTENRFAVFRENFMVRFLGWSENPFWTNTKNSQESKLTPFNITPEEEDHWISDYREFSGFGQILANKIQAGFLNKGKILVVGGFLDGCLKVYHLESLEEPPQRYYYHNETITVLEIDEKERFLVTGSKSGECILWHIGSNYNLTKKTTMYDHEGEILSLHISSEMKVFMTGGVDQRIFVYNYMTGQIMKSLVHPDQHPINSLIVAGSPLPCIVFFSEVDQIIYSYSVNGQFLEKVKEEATSIRNLTICKNVFCLEMLIYTTNKGELVMRSLPFLELKKRVPVPGIMTMEIAKDRKFILSGCSGGSITVFADPSYAKKICNPDMQE